MRVLIVGPGYHVHLTRYLSALSGVDWDVHVFPSWFGPAHAGLRNLTYYHPYGIPPAQVDPSVRMEWLWGPSSTGDRSESTERGLFPDRDELAALLATVIDRIKPDVVHALHFHSGFLTLRARAHLGDRFPPWIVTNYGSDLFYYARYSAYAARAKALLEAVDYYESECHRDIGLARAFGYRGAVLPAVPVTGGFDVDRVRRLRRPGPTSGRRTIALKGYESELGRAIVGLAAIERNADVLAGYRVAIYSAAPATRAAAEEMSQRTGVDLEIVPPQSHDDMLRLHGRARVSIGLSLSDGICASFLEALIMGAFPIQTTTACANEWASHGESAFFVSWQDVEGMSAAIRRAITDDRLVDQAAEINAQTAAEHLDDSVIRPRILEFYERAAADARFRGRRS